MEELVREFEVVPEGVPEEVQQLRREEAAGGLISRAHADRVERYLKLKREAPDEAEAYVAGIIRPKRPLQVAIRGPTGERLDTRELLGCNYGGGCVGAG